jgi:hypothetical protein
MITWALLGLPSQAQQTDPIGNCQVEGWDLSHDMALFEGKPAEVAATSEPNQAPSIEPGKLYSLKLLPRAVFLRMPVKEAGSYRVTFSEAATADVLVSLKKATPTATRSFPECKLFQKSVEVVLPASDNVVVQLSGTQSSSKSVKLAVVPAHRSYSK